MAIEVRGWNILDGFSDSQRGPEILDVINWREPTVAVFPEAWQESKPELLGDVEAKLASKYVVIRTLYDDTDGREDRHGLLGIVRKDCQDADIEPSIVSLGSRNAVRLPVIDPDTKTRCDVFGIHFDDRTEERRIGQASALCTIIDRGKPTVVVGDFNSMHYEDVRARVLRGLGPMARRIPSIDPSPEANPPKLKRIGSLAQRLTGMATGTTLQIMKDAGFVDVDQRHRATKGFVQLDRVMVSGAEVVIQGLYRGSRRLSDHNAIVAHLGFSK